MLNILLKIPIKQEFYSPVNIDFTLTLEGSFQTKKKDKEMKRERCQCQIKESLKAQLRHKEGDSKRTL